MPTTPILAVDADRPDPRVIAEAARILRRGGLVAFATETVYGLGADATNPRAVARIFEAKGRVATNPLIVHVRDKTAALDCVADWPDRANALADRFWPGPLTLILARSQLIPDIVTADQETVGVRVPNLPVARWLILETGRPIAAPSANRSLGVSPTLAQHVFDDLDGKVDLILDSGPTSVGIESTVLDLSNPTPRVLRPGAITAEQIAEVLGEPVESAGHATGPLKSPGQMAVHYAPNLPSYRVERHQLPLDMMTDVHAILLVGGLPDRLIPVPLPLQEWGRIHRLRDPDEASRDLYAKLREIDIDAEQRNGPGQRKINFLIIIPPPDEPQWRAIRDRIWRATQPWPPKNHLDLL